MANPHRVLPRRRAALVALLRGAVAALNEDGLQDLYRYHGDPAESTVRRWWDRGYWGTHRLTFERFSIHTCTGCGQRVHRAYTAEHDPSCRVHLSREAQAWWNQ
jgi:hypothetical protein